MTKNTRKHVVLDQGSYMIKVGYARDDFPRCIFPCKVAREKRGQPFNINSKSYKVGDEITSWSSMLSKNNPIQRGFVNDWNDMEFGIWPHALYHQLRIYSMEDTPILLTDCPLYKKADREKITQLMFEKFNFPALFIANQAYLSLVASGRHTGIVLEIGDDTCHAVPFYEGYTLFHAIEKIDLAGRDLTNYLMQLLNESKCSFTTSAEREIAYDMKKKCCFVALDFETEIKQESWREISYELHDGQICILDQERFRCPEPLFQPSLLNITAPGIHEMVYHSIMKCDADLRNDLSLNIVLAGNTTLFPGMVERMQKEMNNLISDRPVHIIPSKENSAWIGGSMIAHDPSFYLNKCISRSEYDEFGPAIVHRKCFN